MPWRARATWLVEEWRGEFLSSFRWKRRPHFPSVLIVGFLTFSRGGYMNAGASQSLSGPLNRTNPMMPSGGMQGGAFGRRYWSVERWTLSDGHFRVDVTVLLLYITSFCHPLLMDSSHFLFWAPQCKHWQCEGERLQSCKKCLPGLTDLTSPKASCLWSFLEWRCFWFCLFSFNYVVFFSKFAC